MKYLRRAEIQTHDDHLERMLRTIVLNCNNKNCSLPKLTYWRHCVLVYLVKRDIYSSQCSCYRDFPALFNLPVFLANDLKFLAKNYETIWLQNMFLIKKLVKLKCEHCQHCEHLAKMRKETEKGKFDLTVRSIECQKFWQNFFTLS